MTLELYPIPPLPHDPGIRWGGVEPCCFIMARTPSTTPCIMAGMSSPGSSTWFLGIPWLKRLKLRCHDKSSWKLHWFGSALPWLRPRCAQTSFTKRESHPCFTRRSERLERERGEKDKKLRLGWPWYVSQKTLRDEYVERSNQEPTTGVCSFGRNTGVMWGCFVMRFDSLMLTASCREPCSPGFVSGSPNNFSDARLNSGSCYLTSSLAKLNHAGTGDRVGTLFGDVWWELLYI